MAEDENRAAFGRLCRAVLDEILTNRAGINKNVLRNEQLDAASHLA